MQENISEERRKMLIGAGALGATALAASTLGTTAAMAEGMAGHHHHAAGGKHQELAKSLHHCVATAEACIDHCLDSFKSGDTTLADCAISVQETMAFCTAHAKLASYNSKYLKAMIDLGIQVCGDCEKECRKHEKHASCKACADACATCIKACKAYTV
ncbi:hypothetical protein MMIC_P2297 [Mariprofundus micogutta]|uniref:Four-helix bundle copper-binding protein n=1 Tax=Mariprofundus micogutta TaxID=1921010 RepID=A0A1L8CR15_9PROT|nr:Csp1 family four helix bundle copper storage protein [Mariprofundus micogutta]GAV21314.1 hypothetical protein MMIC_P2297 [Mariprofundus micogutta]